jgi:hypothetical protein
MSASLCAGQLVQSVILLVTISIGPKAIKSGEFTEFWSLWPFPPNIPLNKEWVLPDAHFKPNILLKIIFFWPVRWLLPVIPAMQKV